MSKVPDFNVSQAKISNMRVYSGRYMFEQGDLTCHCEIEKAMAEEREPHDNIRGVAYFPIQDGKYAWFIGQCMDCNNIKVFLVEEKEVFVNTEVKLSVDVEGKLVHLVNEEIPVTRDFDCNDIVGKAENFELSDGDLHCDIEINDWKAAKQLWRQETEFSVNLKESHPDYIKINQVGLLVNWPEED